MKSLSEKFLINEKCFSQNSKRSLHSLESWTFRGQSKMIMMRREKSRRGAGMRGKEKNEERGEEGKCIGEWRM